YELAKKQFKGGLPCGVLTFGIKGGREKSIQAWKELIYRAMDRNFSWNASAHAYEKLYDKLVEM
ncbi:MAG: hypothetical protein SPL66_01875, partial [Lachnospiraceae bacterium]|nr:hypothetical protein [Lachnospiraceae bacterium]